MSRSAMVAVGLCLSATIADAQHVQQYAGMEQRKVKALSAQQFADLRAGRGMGLALPAELNGYPGPSHVLELADKLTLSPDQRVRMKELFDSMKDEAIAVGEQLIRQESELDHLFASKAVTLDTLAASTAAIARTQGELRIAHLRYHVSALTVLTPGQVKRYAELRGYESGQAPQHGHGR